MSLLDEISSNELKERIKNRDIILEVLEKCSRELKNGKKEMDNIEPDPCHMAAPFFLKSRYNFIIENIDEMIEFMKEGDWCISVESTKKKEEEMNKK